MKYKCLKCNKEFKQKGHYDAHNNRKISCVYNNDDILETNILPQNSSILPQNSSILPQNLSSNIYSNNKIYCCIYCSKTYSRKDNLIRHQESYCKNKISCNDDKLMIKQLIEQNKQMNEKINELNTTLLNMNQVSKTKNTKKINSNLNYNSNNSNSNNTINNNIQQNIMLGFGSENLSKITEAEMIDVFKSYPNSFIKYVKVVNLNERIPENQTILIKNSKSEVGSVVEDNKLILKDKNKIIEELIQNRLPEIKKFAEDYLAERKISRKEYDFVMTSINFLETSFFETEDVDGNIIKADKDTVKKLKEIYKELLYQFYDYRKMVSDNIKKLLVEPLVNPIMDLLDDSEY